MKKNRSLQIRIDEETLNMLDFLFDYESDSYYLYSRSSFIRYLIRKEFRFIMDNSKVLEE